MLAGLVCFLISTLMLRLRIDDPLDAVAVHLGGGCLGVICVPFFTPSKELFYIEVMPDNTNIQTFHTRWESLGKNLVGLFCIILWTVVWSLMIFGILKFFGKLRVDIQTEELGNDIVSKEITVFQNSYKLVGIAPI